MKKIFAIAAVCMLLLAGCGSKRETQPETQPEVVPPTGAGQPVIPEEGDISIEIG